MDQMENQKYSEDEVEIDMREVFAYIARKFKTVLLWGVVFMLVMGGYRGFKNVSTKNDEAAVSAEQEDYEKSLALYDAQKAAYEEEIENIYSQLNSEKEYQENSILMSIDPFNEYRDTVTYYVYTDYQIMPGMDYQNVDPASSILAAYATAAENIDMNSEIIQNMNVEITSRDLQELISVSCDRNADNNTSAKAETGTTSAEASATIKVPKETRVLTITTIGNTQELADQLMNYVKEQISSQKDTITAEIGEHELRLIHESSGITVDQDLQEELALHSDTIVTLQENLASLQESLDALEKPEAPSAGSWKYVIANTLKYAALGFLIGAVLAALFIGIAFVNKDLCSEDDELTERYGIPVLGSIASHEPRGAFERWSDRIRGIQRNATAEDQQYALIMEYLRNLKNQPGSIAVVSDMDGEKARKIVGHLKEHVGTINLVYSGNTATDAEAMHSMNEQDTVLLLTDRDSSTRKNVTKILKSCTNCGKKICGAVVCA